MSITKNLLIRLHGSLLFFFVIALSAAASEPTEAAYKPWQVFIYAGGARHIYQDNIKDVLETAGYRSGDCGDGIPSAECPLSGGADIYLRYPSISFGGSYRKNARLQFSFLISTVKTDERFYGNIGTSNPSKDNLKLVTRNWHSDWLVDYIIRSYPNRKKAGFQFSASGGVSILELNEELTFLIPVSDSTQSSSEFFEDRNAAGLSALFSFEAQLFINRSFSFTPMRLMLTLPVIRPSFSESSYSTDAYRRTLTGRNYELPGLFWYFGAAFHF